GRGSGAGAAAGIESTVRGTCPLSASTCATTLPDDLREVGVAACVRGASRLEESAGPAAGGGAGRAARTVVSSARTTSSGSADRGRVAGGVPGRAGASAASAVIGATGFG